ncbi:MAG: Si-specific NAD(P)(+) transhydrogenase [Acidobacteria bacterium]|nr:Si-specific NAD(P)(+) transhydrogenase [Acidobacteriota bacterium]
MARNYDLAVIGSGPAGHSAAIQARRLGARVAIVEKRYAAGGECVNTGTIPSKAMREAVLHLTGYRQRGFYGAGYTVKETITAEDLRRRTYQVVELESGVFDGQLRRSGVEVLRGRSFFLDPRRLGLEGCAETDEIRADSILVASGSTPARPASVPFDGAAVVDSESFLSIPSLPRSIIVMGAGVVGVEYACMTAVLGIRTVLVDKREGLLGFLDRDIVEGLRAHLGELGVSLRLGEEGRIVRTPGGVRVELGAGALEAEMLLYAVGRQGNVEGLGLEKAGLEADARGRIGVDDHFRTRTPGIFAAGDVVGFPSLASVSMEQGRRAACCALGASAPPMAQPLPSGIYTIPEMSTVGATEAQLKAEGVPYETGLARFGEIARSNIVGNTCGLMKLLFHRETGRLLGVHILGEGAAELVHIGQAVLAFGGGRDYFLETVFNYPTLAECYKVAAMAGESGPRRG